MQGGASVNTILSGDILQYHALVFVHQCSAYLPSEVMSSLHVCTAPAIAISFVAILSRVKSVDGNFRRLDN